VKPGGHPVAVISYDYWQRRFAGDPGVIGRRFRLGRDPFEIVGVAPRGFSGTEPGTMTDIFLPTMSNAAAIDSSYWSWFRIWVRVKPGSSRERCTAVMRAAIAQVRAERVKTWPADRQQHDAAEYLRVEVTLDPAAAGVSEMSREYRTALTALSIVAGLVLLIACLNVANLMSGQGAARGREMAMRVSIGAGRGRLVQLVLVESALMTACASMLGALLAAWAAPFVVGRLSSAADDLPIRLALPADWRVVGFATLLGLLVTGLFGIIPALRASAVPAMSVLRGGGVSGSRRLLHGLIAAQVAFCFVVQLAAGLFITTFHRLQTQPTGFVADGLVALEAVTRQSVPLDVEYWEQVRHHLEQVDGVESVARCWSPPMSGNSWTSSLSVNGGAVDPRDVYFMGVTPGWLKTMRVRLLDGRDLTDADDTPHAALVNEAFARRYTSGRSPVGLRFRPGDEGDRVFRTVVGYVADARYNDLRGPVYPIVYVPMRGHGQGKDWSFFMVRARPGVQLPALAQRLSPEVRRARPEFRAVSVHSMRDLVDQHTVRERLLAMLSAFFAVVAVLIACVGIYGTLHQWVVQRRRDIGIRLALGAPASHLVAGATRTVFAMLLLGSVAGVALGLGAQRYIGDLLYGVRATDWQMLALPVVTILGAAALAALPPVMRALRVDPVTTLRAE
jgi:predicted permease